MSWLLTNTIVAAVLTLLVLGAARIWKLRPALMHALWLIVIVKLACPPLFEIGLPIAAPAVFAAEPAAPPPPVASPLVARHVSAPLAMSTSRVAPRVVDGEAAATELSVADGLLIVWGVGAVLLALVMFFGVVRLSRRVWRGESAPEWLEREVVDLAHKLGVKAPRLRVVAGVPCAFVWSIGRPTLVWPAHMLEGVDARRVRAVLAHELAHVKRRDHWIARAESVLACALWWHPLFWFARARMRLQAELACDAWAVWASPDARREYAGALIDAIENESQAVSAMPALGVWSGAGRAFEERLTMILHADVARRVSRWAVIPLALVSTLALSSVSFAQSERNDRQDPRRAESQRLDELSEAELKRLNRRIQKRLSEIEKREKRRVERARRDAERRETKRRGGKRRDAKGRDPKRRGDPRKRRDRLDGGDMQSLRDVLDGALEDSLREIRADPDLREIGMTEDVAGLVQSILGDGDLVDVCDSVRGIVDKSVRHGLREASRELEAEGLPNAEVFEDLGNLIGAAVRGDENVDASKFERSMNGFLGGVIEMGLSEARRELEAEGMSGEFLGDLGGLIESSIRGEHVKAEQHMHEFERSISGFVGEAIRMGLEEAKESSPELHDAFEGVGESVGRALDPETGVNTREIDKLLRELEERTEELQRLQKKIEAAEKKAERKAKRARSRRVR